MSSVGVTTFGRRRGEPQAARWIFFCRRGDEKKGMTLIYRDSAAPRASALGRRLFLASRGKRRVLILLKGK